MASPNPRGSTPDEPKYSEYRQQRVRDMRAQFVEEAKPTKLTFNLAADAQLAVDEAINLAKEYTGTPHKSRALEHLYGDTSRTAPTPGPWTTSRSSTRP